MCDERDKSNASFTDNGGNVLHLLLHRSTTLQFVCPIRQIDTSTLQSLAASRILIPCFSTLKLKRLSCCEIYISCVFFRSPVFARLSVVFSVSRHDLELWQNALAHKSLGYTTRGYINPCCTCICGFQHNGFHVNDTVTFVCVYDLLISYKFRNMSSFASLTAPMISSSDTGRFKWILKPTYIFWRGSVGGGWSFVASSSVNKPVVWCVLLQLSPRYHLAYTVELESRDIHRPIVC